MVIYFLLCLVVLVLINMVVFERSKERLSLYRAREISNKATL